MQRRTALKNVALTVGGLVSLPAWAKAWAAPNLAADLRLFKANQKQLLAEIVETIIPETTTPGAKTLQIETFMMRMVQDCYAPASQELLSKGLVMVDETTQKMYQKNFIDCDKIQREATLSAMSNALDPTQVAFFGLVKNLTIQGYMNSEYVMTNLTHYEFAPARYYGCVPIKQ